MNISSLLTPSGLKSTYRIIEKDSAFPPLGAGCSLVLGENSIFTGTWLKFRSAVHKWLISFSDGGNSSNKEASPNSEF